MLPGSASPPSLTTTSASVIGLLSSSHLPNVPREVYTQTASSPSSTLSIKSIPRLLPSLLFSFLGQPTTPPQLDVSSRVSCSMPAATKSVLVPGKPDKDAVSGSIHDFTTNKSIQLLSPLDSTIPEFQSDPPPFCCHCCSLHLSLCLSHRLLPRLLTGLSGVSALTPVCWQSVPASPSKVQHGWVTPWFSPMPHYQVHFSPLACYSAPPPLEGPVISFTTSNPSFPQHN